MCLVGVPRSPVCLTSCCDRPARPTETTITVLWSPPKNKSIRVRGYTLGWGRGVPDTYTEIVNEGQHYYVIEGLGMETGEGSAMKQTVLP